MKFIHLLFCLFICFQLCQADITHNAQKRIEELEKEIGKTEKTLENLKQDKKNKQKITTELERKIRKLQNTIYYLKNQKNSKISELEKIFSNMNRNEKNTLENKTLLNKIIKNLNKFHIQKKYLDYQPIRNSYISNLNICANSILQNLDTLSQVYSEQKDKSEKTKTRIQKLKRKLKNNQQNRNQNIKQKEDEQNGLNQIINLEKGYEKRINEFQGTQTRRY